MIRYIIIGKKDKIRVVRYRGPHTSFRFPKWTMIANGLARCVKDARKRFYEFNASK